MPFFGIENLAVRQTNFNNVEWGTANTKVGDFELSYSSMNEF